MTLWCHIMTCYYDAVCCMSPWPVRNIVSGWALCQCERALNKDGRSTREEQCLKGTIHAERSKRKRQKQILWSTATTQSTLSIDFLRTYLKSDVVFAVAIGEGEIALEHGPNKASTTLRQRHHDCDGGWYATHQKRATIAVVAVVDSACAPALKHGRKDGPLVKDQCRIMTGPLEPIIEPPAH